MTDLAKQRARSAREAKTQRILGENVARLRKANGLTLKAIAESAEMHWRHVQKIEAGEVNATLYSLLRLALAFDVEVWELLIERKT